MAVNDPGKEYCAYNLVTMVIESLCELFPSASRNQLLTTFSQSKTYSLLYDFETRLWAEGPDYILEMYAKETGFDIPEV